MADYEVSKLMWVTIVIALAASIFVIAKPEIQTQAQSVFDKVGNVVGSISLGEDTGDPGDDKPVLEGNYGENGYFEMDKAGVARVYALDDSKPILIKARQAQTYRNADMKTLTFESPVVASGNLGSFFSRATALTEIKGLDKWDTSAVTNINAMFSNDTALTSLDLSSWNVSKVESFGSMFSGMDNLSTLNLTGWDTSSAIDMNSMFESTRKLTTINGLTNLNVSNVTSMSNMFKMATAISNIDLTGWNTAKVLNMNSMFANTLSLNTLKGVEAFDTSSLTDAGAMFSNTNIETLDLSAWNTPNLANVSLMFNNAHNLRSVGDLSGWHTFSMTQKDDVFTGSSVDDIPKWAQ